MTDEELDKKAKEYAIDNYETCLYDNLPYLDDSRAREQSFKDGVKFGFSNANEWHYVSEEGHPNKDDIYLTIRKDGLHLGDFCQGGDGDIDCQSWCDYPSEEEIQDDSVIAWKEIVLPELPKESK